MTQHATTLKEDPLWYKDAVIYQLHVKAFFDSNDSGAGDFRGLVQKLDYIQSLGVNTLWLLPFYPSPLRDDGYDIADYLDVHPDYGTIDDFRAFVEEAHTRGLRVITELVINHTSDQHPWFQAARQAPPGSPERDMYVWSDTDQKFPETRIIFTDTEQSNWAWDPVAEAYYWHRFFSHQPDLNHNNPAVVEAVIDVMRFWFDIGVDGVRLDAIPYLCVREGTNNENLPETHAVLRRMRRVLDEQYPNRCFLAEANQWPEDVRDYFGDGDECHMAYHFPLMPRMYMALAQEDRHPIIEILAQTPAIPDSCQWAIFLRNHDELTLEMVTDEERDYMYRTYATHPRMRVNVGIRRRLAPLLDNSRDKIELMNNLLMTLPGTPIVYYGDELGMGDNIYLGDRDSVRTPMQWNLDRNGGFSQADPLELYLPPVTSSEYGYQTINVEALDASPHSLLNWMRRLIHVRNGHPAWGRGEIEFLHPTNRKVLAYLRSWQDETLLCVANLSRDPQPVALNLSAYRGMVPLELSGRTAFPAVGDGHYVLSLPGYGFYWFQLTVAEEEALPAALLEPAEPVPVLVWFDGWRSLDPASVAPERRELAQRVSRQFHQQALARWLPVQRWYAGKGQVPQSVRYRPLPWASGEDSSWLWGTVRVGEDAEYLLPLAVTWGGAEELEVGPQHPYRIAPVRRHARMGALLDAAADPRFVRDLVRALAAGGETQVGDALLRYRPRPALGNFPTEVAREDVEAPGEIGTNTTVRIGDWGFLKLYRGMHQGVSVEVEVGEFLTERTEFANAVDVLGSIELVAPGEAEGAPVAVLQELVEHQGSAWDLVVGHQRRIIQNLEQRDYLHYMIGLLGQRTGQMHQALCTETGDPAFDPEPVTSDDLRAWVDGVAREAEETFVLLEGRLDSLGGHERELAERLLAARHDVVGRVRGWKGKATGLKKTRYHGDYHLGQVLVVEEDFVVIDFEGEPARSLEERRRKHSALKDVAGLLRSFDYAAFVSAAETLEPSGLSPLDLTLSLGELRETACTEFLDGYREIVGGTGWKAARQMLELFLWEKALYELRYELNTRPQWVVIPLHSLERFFLG